MTRNVRYILRLIWLLIGGGGVLFIAAIWLLDHLHPGTPANELVTRHTVWVFGPSVLMALCGAYVSLRYWRCPYCNWPLRTKFPVPRNCTHCGKDIGLFD